MEIEGRFQKSRADKRGSMVRVEIKRVIPVGDEVQNLSVKRQ